MNTWRFVLAVLAFANASLVASVARAGQPTMMRADPAPNSVVTVSPMQIRVWFSDELDPLCRVLVVRDSHGREVDSQDTSTDPDDSKELIVTIPDRIYNGHYSVSWEVTTGDGRQNHGSFGFTVDIKD
jgi:methionine-rich copper-binding protein CopC